MSGGTVNATRIHAYSYSGVRENCVYPIVHLLEVVLLYKGVHSLYIQPSTSFKNKECFTDRHKWTRVVNYIKT